MAVITLGIAFTFIHATRFLLRMFDETLWVSQTDMKSALVSFDREKLAFFAPKLGINPPSGAASKETPIALPSPSSSPFPQPSTMPREALHVDKKALHLRILNGTAISGLAKQWGDWFVEQGFTRVTTGNAPERGHVSFSITYSSEKKDYLDALREVIRGHGANIGQEVEDNALSSEITIIIGMP